VGLYDRLVTDADPGRSSSGERDTVRDGVRRRLHDWLIGELGPSLYDGTITDGELRRRVDELLGAAVAREQVVLSDEVLAGVAAEVADDVFGFGPLEPLLADEAVTEVMCNGPASVWVERSGRLEPTDVSFLDADHLRRVIDKIVGGVGRRVDESAPLCDARLPDGSRVNAVLPPVAVDGPFLTVRKFGRRPPTAGELVAGGTLDGRVLAFLEACVAGRRNIVVSGGTGSGKTTLLNVISTFIPAGERIVTVEDAKELQLAQRHVVGLEARPPSVEGTGAVTIRDLVRNSLRMRPDRIVVGEVRSGEALDMLQAMNTGHTGSLTTVHANSPRDALARLETLVLMAGYDLPVRAIRGQLASAIDLVVQMARFPDGGRRITAVTEVQGMEGDIVVAAELFVRRPATADGVLHATGIRPRSAAALAEQGINLPESMFAPASPAAPAAPGRQR
jgi:pilus assembly protein CpaF